MTTPARRTCPSCQTPLSALAAECPECGLALAPPQAGRPMLFQASALAQARFDPPPRVLTSPALGRVAPVAVEVALHELQPVPQPEGGGAELARLPAEPAEPVASFWPLVKVECLEALLLLFVLAGAVGLPAWVLGVPPLRLLVRPWPFTLPYLLAVAWLFFMAPLVMTGQSPLMGRFGVALAEELPERRMAFSLVHLVSVACFPLSFLCMVLSPRHQTLAELLSGQDLLARPLERLR